MQPKSPDLIALFQSCDMFVLPTDAEAFGIVVEASPATLLVIETAVRGLRDVVVDGQTAFLIKQGDVPKMRYYLGLLAENQTLRQRLGQAARQHAETFFKAKINADHVVECFKQLIPAR